MIYDSHFTKFEADFTKIMRVLRRTLTLKRRIFPFSIFQNTAGSRECQGSWQNSFEFVSVSSRFINLKSELYRFATIGDKILIALALIAASGVGISQGGDH